MSCPLSSTSSFSAHQRPAAGPADSTATASIIRSSTVYRPDEEPLERVVQAARLDLGEVAELPDVHAEHGGAALVDRVDRAQHRPVPAERDRQIEAARELVGRDGERREVAEVARRAGRRTSSPCSWSHAAAWRASSMACGRSGCGTSPTVRNAVPLTARPPRRWPRPGPAPPPAARAGPTAGTRGSRRRRGSGRRVASTTGQRPRRARPAASVVSTSAWTAGSRTTPPRGTRPRPASNCGLASSTRSASGVVTRASAGATVSSEMNGHVGDRERHRPADHRASRARALVRSSRLTRGSVRSDQASCPRPTSTAWTWPLHAAAGSR